MAAGDDAVDDLDTDPVTSLLDQDEIDSLLGINGGGAGSSRSGMAALIDTSTVSYERLPMLEVVFDRLVRIMTTSLRNFTSENLEVTLESTDSLRFNDYLNGVPLPALIAVFRAMEWDNFGLMTIDGPLIYSMLDLLLGGRRGGTAARVEGRSYTHIERRLVERLVTLVLEDMSKAFEPVSSVQFRFERLETNPRFAAIARPTNAVVLFKLRVDLDDRGGHIYVLIPYATLEPVRDLLLQQFIGEKFGRDTIWERHLAEEMLVTHVDLDVLLDQQTVPLGALMELRVGEMLPIEVPVGRSITLRCGQVPLMFGRLGRVQDRMAVRVEGRIETRGGAC